MPSQSPQRCILLRPTDVCCSFDSHDSPLGVCIDIYTVGRKRVWIKCISALHGSLEGVGGLNTNEAYHSKADALVIPKM